MPVVALRVAIVAMPVTFKSVSAIPPMTSNSVFGIVLPMPTLFLSASARIRLVFTSKPFLTTKIFINCHLSSLSPSYFLLFILFVNKIKSLYWEFKHELEMNSLVKAS